MGATVSSAREALPATSPLTRSNAKSGQKYHTTPASFFTGASPGGSGQKKEIEKPRPSPAGPQKSLYAVFSARETSLVHPLKVDSRMRERHTIVAVRLKPRITILPNENERPAAELHPPRGDRPFNTTRQNGSCLCAISHLGSYMSCQVGRSRAGMAASARRMGPLRYFRPRAPRSPAIARSHSPIHDNRS